MVATFQELCNPGVKIPAFITKFTGISNEMLVGKPSPEAVMLKLHEFIGERPIIAHNSAFDSKFLVSEMKRVNIKITNKFLCTLLLSRRILQGLTSYKLSFLKSALNYKAAADHCDHRALDDVLVTVHLWNHLHNVLRSRGVSKISADLLVTISKLPKKCVYSFLDKTAGEIIESNIQYTNTGGKYKSPTKRKRDDGVEFLHAEETVVRRSPRLQKVKENCKSPGKLNKSIIDLTDTPTRRQKVMVKKVRHHRQCLSLMDIFKRPRH